MAVGSNTLDNDYLGGKREEYLSELNFGISRNVFNLSLCLMVLQVLDGILTTIGINRFGSDAEGNPFLRVLIENIGHIPALTLVKLLGMTFIVILALSSKRIPWISSALRGICYIYFFTAIIPWTYLLFIRV